MVQSIQRAGFCLENCPRGGGGGGELEESGF